MSVGGILSNVGQSIYRTVTTHPISSVAVVGVSALGVGLIWNVTRGRGVEKSPIGTPNREASKNREVEAIVEPLLRGRSSPSSSSSAPPMVEARPSLIDWRSGPDQAKSESIRSNVAGWVGAFRVSDEEFQRTRLSNFSHLDFEELRKDLRGEPVSEGGLAVLDQILRLQKSPGEELFSIRDWNPPVRDQRLSCLFDPLLFRSGFERLAYLIKNELLPEAKGLLERLPDGDQKEALRGYIEEMEFKTPLSLEAFAAMLDAKDESDRPFFLSYLEFLKVNDGVDRPEWAQKVSDVYRKAFNGEARPISGYVEHLTGLPFCPFESAALTIRLLEAVGTTRKRVAPALPLSVQFQPLLEAVGRLRGLDEDHAGLLCDLSNPARWAQLRSSWYMHLDREERFSDEGRQLLALIQRLREAPGSEPFNPKAWEGQQMGRLPSTHPLLDALRDRSQLEGVKRGVGEELLPEAAQLYTQLPAGGRKERLGGLIVLIDQAQKGTLAQFAEANPLLKAYQALLWEIRIEGTEQERALIPTRGLMTQKVIPSDLLAAASFDFDPYDGAELTVRVWEVMTKGLKETS